jgi:hypothetical protein
MDARVKPAHDVESVAQNERNEASTAIDDTVTRRPAGPV